VVTPGSERYILFAALCAGFLTCLLLRPMSMVACFISGLFVSLLVGAGFSWSFMLSGYWIDPLIPVSAAVAGTLVSTGWALALKRRFSRRFRNAYGPFVSPFCLKAVTRAGRPLPAETVSSRAVMVAVRNPLLLVQEAREDAVSGSKRALAFQQELSGHFRKAGGVVVGCEGDLVLGCFGSPPERIAAKAQTPAAGGAPEMMAVHFITELLKLEGSENWCFGLDAGNCAFTWSPLSGYSAFGRPTVRSRILSNLCSRYKAPILITAAVYEKLEALPVCKLGALKEKDGSGSETFYQLLLTGGSLPMYNH
jgi:hypothetical protein